MNKSLLWHSLSTKLVLIFLAFIVASASFSGFFEKWNFRDGTRMSGMRTVDGTAYRPFVYRQLLPSMARFAEKVTPPSINKKFQDWLAQDPMRRNMIYRYFPNATDSADVKYAVRYYTLYSLTFASLFFAIFAIRALCYELYADMPAATLAAFTMALLLPVFMTEGGFFYDMPELLFMALAVLLAIKGRIVLLAIAVALGTVNKESFLLFVLTLFPFLRTRFSLRATLGIEAILLGIALVINLLIKMYYADNPGDLVQTQLLSHIKWLLHPSAYMEFEVNYSMPTPKGFNIVHLVLIALVAGNAWRYLSPTIRQHFWIAFIINFPLFLAFCYRGELRNLSMLYVTLVLMICINISMFLQRWYRGKVFFPSSVKEQG